MASFLNQLSAIFYKNRLLSKPMLISHTILLVVLPLLAGGPLIAMRSSVSSNKSVPVDYYSLAIGTVAKEGEKYFVFCEDCGDADNQKLYDTLEDIIGAEHLIEIPPTIMGESGLDEFFLAKDGEDEEWQNRLRGGFIIRAMKTLDDGTKAYNITFVKRITTCCREAMLLGRVFNFALLKLNNPLLATYSIGHHIAWAEKEIRLNLAYLFGSVAGVLVVLALGVFVSMGIQEKEDRIFMLMRLNGVSFRGYFCGQWLYFTCLLVLPFTLGFVILCLAPAKLSPMFFLAIIQFVLHALLTSNIGIILGLFFKRKMVAHVLIYYLFTQGYVGVMLIGSAYWWTCFIPIAGSGTSIGKILTFTSVPFAEAITNRSVWVPILMTIAYNILFFFLGSYLFNVLKLGYQGALKPWHYFITELFTSDTFSELRGPDMSAGIADDDVRKMYELIIANPKEAIQTNTLVLSHVRKLYKGGKLAVDDVTLGLKENQIFGLLGPNGAGKTTLLHIIAGLYSASSGNVILEGCDSQKNRHEYHQKIGFCPQHDIFWKNLTLRQHLRFFEMLRGTESSRIEENIRNTLESVRLMQYADQMAAQISGGERRRLSLAMALSGESRVILLDEPTTGLDPKVRRIVWDIIGECRKGRLCILTTHSLEEAELLSDNITIMAHGRLKCLGTPGHLKRKFGGSIFVGFENENGRFQDAVQGIRECCPEGTSVSVVSEGLNSISGKMRFSGDKKQGLILMRALVDRKSSFGIKNFGITQSSLDDVFMNVIREVDADA